MTLNPYRNRILLHFFTYTNVQKVWVCIFYTAVLCLPRLHLFDQKYSKNGNGVNNYYNLK